MAPRASWKGQLKLSLVSLPVRLYNAVSSTSRISLNQLHRDCHRRLKQQMICPEHGPVERPDIVKGYEYEKGKYVILDDTDLEQIRLETNKSIELIQFVEADELDSLFLDAPYYVAPDGPVGEEAFAVVREAMRATNRVAIGRVVLSNREHIVALKVHEQGFVLSTLRFANEVRSATPYFEEIRPREVDANQMQLAQQLIEQYTKPFEPDAFSDRYQDAMLELVRAKVEGTTPVIAQADEVGKVINLMDALKASLSEAPERKPPARSIKQKEPAAAKKKKAKRA